MQNVSREGQRPRSSGEAAPGGRAASEEQEANEENEEQDGRESHGPCLPSIRRSSKNLGVSVLLFCPMGVEVVLGSCLGRTPANSPETGESRGCRGHEVLSSQQIPSQLPWASDGLELSWWAMPLNREYVPHGRGVVPAEGTCGGCT